VKEPTPSGLRKAVEFGRNGTEFFLKEENNMISTAHAPEEFQGKIIEVDIHEKKGLDQYKQFVPETQSLVSEAEKVRILVTMHDFDGWEAGTLWATANWDAAVFDHIERVAVVGEKAWQDCATGFSKPFKTATVRYFTNGQLDAARAWLNE
jgi:hypothetical protein